MPGGEFKQVSQGGSPAIDLSRDSAYLAATLEVQCDSATVLVVPKALAVRLRTAILVRKYLERSLSSLSQFHEDIDQDHERSPDAKSLADFHEFAIDISEQMKRCIDPIADDSRRNATLLLLCQEATNAIGMFTRSVGSEILSCAEELCKTHCPESQELPLADQLIALQRLDLRVRMGQRQTVRSCLDRLQTCAHETLDTLGRTVDKLRDEVSKLRTCLLAVERICNSHGNLNSPEIAAAFQDHESFYKRI